MQRAQNLIYEQKKNPLYKYTHTIIYTILTKKGFKAVLKLPPLLSVVILPVSNSFPFPSASR